MAAVKVMPDIAARILAEHQSASAQAPPPLPPILVAAAPPPPVPKNANIAGAAAAAELKGTGGDAERAETLQCHICAESETDGGCPNGHRICRACAKACILMRNKLGAADCDIPLSCPIEACDGLVADIALAVAAIAAPVQRIARLVRIDAGSAEHDALVREFGKTMAGATVVDVFRVENSALAAIYGACRARMTREGRTIKAAAVGANEAFPLWHATSRAAAGAIVREGFDAHRAGQAHGTALGAGIYVARDARFSDGYAKPDPRGTCAMLACRVLLGDTGGRDSRSDGAASPMQYSVHREQQVLPAFVVYYRRATAVAAAAAAAVKSVPSPAVAAPAAAVAAALALATAPRPRVPGRPARGPTRAARAITQIAK
jgi:hypothetical protein